MTVNTEAAALQTLLDREAIKECIFSYCRGIDRVDEAALRSAYWPDATDRHGPYQGSATGFIEWALAKLREGGRMVHFVGNMSIQLNGDVAGAETYFQAFQQGRDSAGENTELFLIGRYADRFEKRDGEWRIAERVVIYDWIREERKPRQSDDEWFGDFRQPRGGRKPDDPVYDLLARVAAA